MDGFAVSCPTRSVCTEVGSFTNNIPFFNNMGPKVTFAAQWNGQGLATGTAGGSGTARTTRSSPCARALGSISAAGAMRDCR
jgi:hypothetical protein